MATGDAEVLVCEAEAVVEAVAETVLDVDTIVLASAVVVETSSCRILEVVHEG